MKQMPDAFLLLTKNFFELAKSDSHVNIFDRHKIQIEYDTKCLSKLINDSPEPETFVITKNRLGL